MLCSGLANGYRLFGAGEGEQIRSISRNAVYRNVSTANGDSMDNWMEIHMDFCANAVGDTDVPGVSGRDV